MTPQEQWDGPIQDAIREHDESARDTYPISFFEPPSFPTGGTVYHRSSSRVDWFRRMPNGGGTVFVRPDTPEETQ